MGQGVLRFTSLTAYICEGSAYKQGYGPAYQRLGLGIYLLGGTVQPTLPSIAIL